MSIRRKKWSRSDRNEGAGKCQTALLGSTLHSNWLEAMVELQPKSSTFPCYMRKYLLEVLYFGWIIFYRRSILVLFFNYILIYPAGLMML